MSHHEDLQSEVYYRIYLSHQTQLLTIVCMQDFDEHDYVQHRFLTGKEDEILKFNSEEEAIKYLNKFVPPNKFDPEYLSADSFVNGNE